MKGVYTVKQINEYVKNMFAQDFVLNRIYIKGEVSNCTYHGSGHIYFSLKDESGTISCVMFAGSRSGLSFNMRQGDQVVALGSISVFPRDGKYQLYAKEIIKEGAGDLHEKFEALKNELHEMGMFASEYKVEIPKYPKTIGVITAPTGAAVQDIIQIVQRRNPFIQIVLFPALVQGDGATISLIKGLEYMESVIKPDVIILGRGGGSLEDLWAFNERELAQAMFHCSIPIISAVGHETDTTIADYVADLRAPTPSAAAELAAFEYSVVKKEILLYEHKISREIGQRIQLARLRVEKATNTMKFLHPENRLKENQHRLIQLEERINELIHLKIKNEKNRLQMAIVQLKGLSPLEKLTQGYSYVSDQKGNNISRISDVKLEDEIDIAVSDGRIKAKVVGCEKEKHYVTK